MTGKTVPDTHPCCAHCGNHDHHNQPCAICPDVDGTPKTSTAAGDYTPAAVAELIEHLTSVIQDEDTAMLDLLDALAKLIEGYAAVHAEDAKLIAKLKKARPSTPEPIWEGRETPLPLREYMASQHAEVMAAIAGLGTERRAGHAYADFVTDEPHPGLGSN